MGCVFILRGAGGRLVRAALVAILDCPARPKPVHQWFDHLEAPSIILVREPVWRTRICCCTTTVYELIARLESLMHHNRITFYSQWEITIDRYKMSVQLLMESMAWQYMSSRFNYYTRISEFTLIVELRTVSLSAAEAMVNNCNSRSLLLLATYRCSFVSAMCDGRTTHIVCLSCCSVLWSMDAA